MALPFRTGAIVIVGGEFAKVTTVSKDTNVAKVQFNNKEVREVELQQCQHQILGKRKHIFLEDETLKDLRFTPSFRRRRLSLSEGTGTEGESAVPITPAGSFDEDSSTSSQTYCEPSLDEIAKAAYQCTKIPSTAENPLFKLLRTQRENTKGWIRKILDQAAKNRRVRWCIEFFIFLLILQINSVLLDNDTSKT